MQQGPIDKEPSTLGRRHAEAEDVPFPAKPRPAETKRTAERERGDPVAGKKGYLESRELEPPK